MKMKIKGFKKERRNYPEPKSGITTTKEELEKIQEALEKLNNELLLNNQKKIDMIRTI